MSTDKILDNSVRRRMLITYAVISRGLDRTQDLLFGLLPFFEPLLIQHNGEVFDKQLFITEVEAALHWTITPDFADQIKGCLIKNRGCNV